MLSMKSLSHLTHPAFVLLLTTAIVLADATLRQAEETPRAPENPADLMKQDRFTFVRVEYDSSGGFGESWYRYEGRDWERWETDFPRAERNLLFRLTELTSLSINPEPISLRLTDSKIFDYPFLFMSDVGWQVLSRQEKRQLHRYLERGGFLWVDDFWGAAEWKNFYENTSDLAADWHWKEIPPEHALMSIVYPLEKCPQIPARIFYAQRKLSYDPPEIHRRPNGGVPDLSQVHFMGLFDGEGQLMAVATHNTDIADGWEREGESQEFFNKFSIQSYAMAINIIVYAQTH